MVANWIKISLLAIGFSVLISLNKAEAKPVVRDLAESVMDPGNEVSSSTLSGKMMDLYAEQLYKNIDFGKSRKLSKEVFTKALKGYLNLKNSGQLDNGREILSVCDFSLSSNVPRLWVIDLRKKKVLFNSLVAHGSGSGEEFATSFSNTEDSHQSSMGFYVTASTYYGDKGYSLKLMGKDPGYNDQAFNRGIIIHGADYVSNEFIRGNQRLGRSWGCPSLPMALTRPIIDAIKGGTALFIYSNNNRYLASSKWLRRLPNIDASQLKPEKENTMLAELVPVNTPVVDTATKVKTKVTPKPIPAEAYFQ